MTRGGVVLSMFAAGREPMPSIGVGPRWTEGSGAAFHRFRTGGRGRLIGRTEREVNDRVAGDIHGLRPSGITIFAQGDRPRARAQPVDLEAAVLVADRRATYGAVRKLDRD